MRVTPECVRLIAQEYKLKELKLMCVHFSPKNQLCDRAFGYHLGSNPSFKNFSVKPDPYGTEGFIEYFIASTALIAPDQTIRVAEFEDVFTNSREIVRPSLKATSIIKCNRLKGYLTEWSHKDPLSRRCTSKESLGL